MWLFTTDGFFSAVQDQNDTERIMVRARQKKDLEAMLEKLELEDTRILEWFGSDYRYRVFIRRLEWAQYVLGEIMALHYTNFKDAALAPDDHERSAAYHSIWSRLVAWQDSANQRSWVEAPEYVEGEGIWPTYDEEEDPNGWLKNYWIRK